MLDDRGAVLLVVVLVYGYVDSSIACGCGCKWQIALFFAASKVGGRGRSQRFSVRSLSFFSCSYLGTCTALKCLFPASGDYVQIEGALTIKAALSGRSKDEKLS